MIPSASSMFNILSLIVVASVFSVGASGEPQARLHHIADGSGSQGGQLLLQLQILNSNKEDPITLPRRILPSFGTNGDEFPYLSQDLFEIRDYEGERASYVGMVARRSLSQASTVRLAPNGVLNYVLDLSQDYALDRDGVYSVIYRGFLDGGDVIISNSVQIQVLHSQGDRRRTSLSTASSMSPGSGTNCDATEHQIFQQSAREATSLTWDAWNCLRSGTCRETFTRWYGSSTPAAHNQVSSHTTRMWQHFNAGTYRTWCNHPQCQSDIYAFVYSTDRTRTINLCGAFWSIPTERAATLIHEMSHFSDVAATQDVAYGEKACLRLAKNQPHQACQFLLLYVGPIVRSLMSGI